MLAEGQDDFHPQLVLDVADSEFVLSPGYCSHSQLMRAGVVTTDTIREVGDELPCVEVEDELPGVEVDYEDSPVLCHYLKWPKEDAESYLKWMLQKYYSAEWVPSYTGGVTPIDDEGTVSSMYHNTP